MQTHSSLRSAGQSPCLLHCNIRQTGPEAWSFLGLLHAMTKVTVCLFYKDRLAEEWSGLRKAGFAVCWAHETIKKHLPGSHAATILLFSFPLSSSQAEVPAIYSKILPERLLRARSVMRKTRQSFHPELHGGRGGAGSTHTCRHHRRRRAVATAAC